MARIARRLAENVDGEFFVDDSCIDCGICREIAPAIYDRSDVVGASIVSCQPRNAEEQRRAEMSLVACPTSSIGTVSRVDLSAARESFPEPLGDGAHDVFFCGWASRSSYGAASWLVVRDQGNVLIDSPRASRSLLERIRALGGARWMFLSHRDDIADHGYWRAHLGCERILHEADVTAATKDVERKMEGTDPVALAPDLLVIPVSGHTRGSAALLYRNEFLFSGDHLWGDRGELDAGRSVCWYSWSEQRRSLELLRHHRFRWVLPGHGSRYRTDSVIAMQAALQRLLARL